MNADRRGFAAQYAQPHRINDRALAAATTVQEVASAVGQGSYGGRFFKLNLLAFEQHGTVEFRQHHGTVNTDEATAWVKLCLRMCATAKVASSLEGDSTLSEFFAKVTAPAGEQAFYTARAASLARRAERSEQRRASRTARLAAQRAEQARVREQRYQEWYNRSRNTNNVE